ncbi:MAG: hypothetical protein ACT4O5_11715 [Gammaproteobacteria bacterium]
MKTSDRIIGTIAVLALTAGTTSLAAELRPAAQAPPRMANVPARFDPKAHGFEFTNYYTGDILVDLPIIGRVNLGATTYGLCGGMVFSAFDSYNLGAAAPDVPVTPPASGTGLRSYLYERQMDSLRRDDWFLVNRLVLWMRKPLEDQTIPNPVAQGGENVIERGLVTLSRRQFRNKIEPGLRSNRPVPIVLVKASGEDLATNPKSAFSKNHQVLAIGFRVAGEDEWEIDIYDPNFPNTVQTLHTKGRYQTARGSSAHTGKFRGYFAAPYGAERPPWVPNDAAVANRLRTTPTLTVASAASED